MLQTVLGALRLALVVGVTVGAFYLMGVTFLWCADGAYNVLQGDDPDRAYAVFLVALGLVPVAAGLCAWLVMRRVGWSRWGAWVVAAAWGGGVSIPVLIVRAWLSMPFI